MKKYITKFLLPLFFISSAQLFALAIGSCEEADFQSDSNPQESSFILVSRVVSADTIVLDNGERIKLIGLKAPLVPKPKEKLYDKYGFVVTEETSPESSVEEQAIKFAKRLLEKQKIRLEFDTKRRDDKLNNIAYVFLENGVFVNAEILRYGFADLQIIPPNFKYEDKLRSAYQEAKREQRGLQGD